MRFLIRNIRALFALLILGSCINALAEPYTPPIGSPERVAIANAVRVPDAAEVGQLRASLPSDYPLSIVNKFWRDLLRGEGKSD